MPSNFNSTAARFGILGVNPYGPSMWDTALRSAEVVGNIFGKMHANRAEGLKNRMTEQTMGALIDKENAVNRAAAQYALPMQQAALGKTNAEIAELQARAAHGDAQARELLDKIQAGVNRAQAAELYARKDLYGAQGEHLRSANDPTLLYDRLLNEYNTAPPESAKKLFVGDLLNQMMGSPSMAAGGISRPSPRNERAPTVGMPPGVGSNLRISPLPAGMGGTNGEMAVNPFTTSRASMKGAEYGVQNPDGTFTAYQSPTQPTITNLQSRMGSEKELEILAPLKQGINPYLGKVGSAKYVSDLAKAAIGNKGAAERLEKAEEAMQVINEAAILRLKMAGTTNIGEEVIHDMVKSMYPSLPSQFLRSWNSPTRVAQATAAVDEALKKGINEQYAPAVLAGFPTTLPEAPSWAPQQAANAPPTFRFTGSPELDRQQLQAIYHPPAVGANVPVTPPPANVPRGTTGNVGGYTMDEINAVAAKYGKTPADVIALINKGAK